MRPVVIRSVTGVCAIAFVLACAENPTESVLDVEGLSFSIVSGDGQVDTPGNELRNPLVVQALDSRDKPVKGQLVGFVVVAGGGSMFVGSNITDGKGLAQDYWTLGPEEGENVVEVRAVDPSTGEKHVFATFTATAKIPTDEVCNGSDDDLDGEIDEGLLYCFDAVPAPNTDGEYCVDGWEDLDADRANGCEAAVGPSWEPQTSGTTARLAGVWGTSPSDVFAAGDDGTILHYDGTSWSAQAGFFEPLEGVWGTSPFFILAWGRNGHIYYYEGYEWLLWDNLPNDLWDIWASSSSDVFAVGSGGTIHHCSHDTHPPPVCIRQFSGTDALLWSVWGSSSTDVFAAGDDGTILHYDGTSWSAQATGTDQRLFEVWGTSSTDVFAVGDDGTILHYDGTSWSAQATGTTVTFMGVWGTSSTDVFAVGTYGTILHYDGTSWSAQPSSTDMRLTGVWGSSSTDVFAVGVLGTIIHYGY